jgi:hypothetical protein
MNCKGLIALAILLALLLAGSPFSLEGHVHESHDDIGPCAICSFASTAVAVAGQPARASDALAWTHGIHPASQWVPAQHRPAANRTRAPPVFFS